MKNNFNARFSAVITDIGVSLSEVGRQTGTTHQTISNIINNKHSPKVDLLVSFVTVYPRVNLQWLLFGEGMMYNKDESLYQDTTLFKEELELKEQEIALLKKEVDFLKKKIERQSREG